MKTKVTDFKIGKYYTLPEWKKSGMCICLKEDFHYHFGIYKDGEFYNLQSNYDESISLLRDYIELK